MIVSESRGSDDHRFVAYVISPAAYGPNATAASRCDRSAMSPTPRTMG
jgi:hypothetical protein